MHCKSTFDRASRLKSTLEALLTEHSSEKHFKSTFDRASRIFEIPFEIRLFEITFHRSFRIKSTLDWEFCLKCTLKELLTEHFVSNAFETYFWHSISSQKHFESTFDWAFRLKSTLKALLTEHLVSKALWKHFWLSISSQKYFKSTFDRAFRLKSTLKAFLTEHFVSKAL